MTGTAVRENTHASTGDLTEAFRGEAPGLLGFFVRRDVPVHDAADCVSETFLAAWRSSGRGEVAPEMLRAWLFGIARKVLSQYRRGRIRRSALADRLRSTLSAGDAARADGSPDGADPEVAAQLRDLILQLPGLDREIVRLVYWEGFSQEEVAAILGKPATTVRTRLSRARRGLKQRLEELGDPGFD